MRAFVSAVICVLAVSVLAPGASGDTLISGWIPTRFRAHDSVPVFVDVMTSPLHPAVPEEYYHDATFCRPPGGVVYSEASVFDLLVGTHPSLSAYSISVGDHTVLSERPVSYRDAKWIRVMTLAGGNPAVDSHDAIELCTVALSSSESIQRLRDLINRAYRGHYRADGLPAVHAVELRSSEAGPEPGTVHKAVKYMNGVPIGTRAKDGNYVLYNHVNITVYYTAADAVASTYRLVRFEMMPVVVGSPVIAEGLNITFSFSVNWVLTEESTDGYENQREIIMGSLPSHLYFLVVLGLGLSLGAGAILYALDRYCITNVVLHNLPHSAVCRVRCRPEPTDLASCSSDAEDVTRSHRKSGRSGRGVELDDVERRYEAGDGGSDTETSHLVRRRGDSDSDDGKMRAGYTLIVGIDAVPNGMPWLIGIHATGTNLLVIGVVIMTLSYHGWFFLERPSTLARVVVIAYVCGSVAAGMASGYTRWRYRWSGFMLSTAAPSALIGFVISVTILPVSSIVVVLTCNHVVGLSYKSQTYQNTIWLFGAMFALIVLGMGLGICVWELLSHYIGKARARYGFPPAYEPDREGLDEFGKIISRHEGSGLSLCQRACVYLLKLICSWSVLALSTPTFLAVYMVYWNAYFVSLPLMTVISFGVTIYNFTRLVRLYTFFWLTVREPHWQWIPTRMAAEWGIGLIAMTFGYFAHNARTETSGRAIFVFFAFGLLAFIAQVCLLAVIGGVTAASMVSWLRPRIKRARS